MEQVRLAAMKPMAEESLANQLLAETCFEGIQSPASSREALTND